MLPYSLFSLGDFVGLGGLTIGGDVAAAGDARIKPTAIDTRLTSDRDNSNVVVVGGTMGGDGGFAIADSLPPIPETASWAMVIAGFGLVGAVQRRCRSLVA